MDVSILIVNYNTYQLTKNCIDSVFQHTTGIDFELILVDNASSDQSRNLFPQDKRIVWVPSPVNVGFGRANNLGCRHARGKYIFLLNSDTLLLNNAVKIFFDYAEAHRVEKLGALGTTLWNAQRLPAHSAGRFPTPWNALLFILSSYMRRFGLDLHKRYFQKPLLNHSVQEVEYITGADLFIPRAVLEQVEFFHPAFFMYFEETDLQKRMEQQGFSRRLIPGARIIHLEGASSPSQQKFNLNKELMFRQSEFTYLRMHSSLTAYLIYRFLLFFLSVLPVLCLQATKQEKKKYLLFLIKGSPYAE